MNRALALVGLAIAGLSAASSADAHGYRLGSIVIGHFWSDPAGAGKTEAGVYGILLNNGKTGDRLVGATTPVAARVRFRALEGDKANWADAIDIPAGRPVALARWRRHLWLTGLKRPLKAGTSFPLTLTFEKAGSIKISIVVGREGMH